MMKNQSLPVTCRELAPGAAQEVSCCVRLIAFVEFRLANKQRGNGTMKVKSQLPPIMDLFKDHKYGPSANFPRYNCPVLSSTVMICPSDSCKSLTGTPRPAVAISSCGFAFQVKIDEWALEETAATRAAVCALGL